MVCQWMWNKHMTSNISINSLVYFREGVIVSVKCLGNFYFSVFLKALYGPSMAILQEQNTPTV